MKKTIILCFAFVLIVILGVLYLRSRQVKLETVNECVATFNYAGTNNNDILSEEDKQVVYELFNGKLLYRDNLSCGFNEKVSLCFDDSKTFCIARDTCPVIYWKEKDMYFRLSDLEQQQLYSLLEVYGFRFPCI